MRLAIVKVVAESGNSAIAIEITTEGELLTLALDGASVIDDTALEAKVSDLIQYIKERYSSESDG